MAKLYNIVGDIAGRYDELTLLLAKMPSADTIVLVGDLNDRGPNSRKVIEWAMENESAAIPVLTLDSNHGQMMVEAYCHNSEDFLYNGGYATLESYGLSRPNFPKEHIDWLASRPLYFLDEEAGLFVSHAPWHQDSDIKTYISKHWAVWNRRKPIERPDLYQVHGHNGLMEEYRDKDNNPWGSCIDDSLNGKLTGLAFPSMTIFQIDYTS